MAETRIVGNDGHANISAANNHDIKLNTWALTINQVISDVTAYGDNWRRKRGGVLMGTFSAGGVLSRTAANTAPDIAPGTQGNRSLTNTGETVILLAHANDSTTEPTGTAVGTADFNAADCGWFGTAVIGNVNVAHTKTGDATITFDGEFDNSPIELWDESTA